MTVHIVKPVLDLDPFESVPNQLNPKMVMLSTESRLDLGQVSHFCAAVRLLKMGTNLS